MDDENYSYSQHILNGVDNVYDETDPKICEANTKVQIVCKRFARLVAIKNAMEII